MGGRRKCGVVGKRDGEAVGYLQQRLARGRLPRYGQRLRYSVAVGVSRQGGEEIGESCCPERGPGVTSRKQSGRSPRSASTTFMSRPSPHHHWESAYGDSLNARLQEELLNREVFDSLLEAQVLVERWRKHHRLILVGTREDNPLLARLCHAFSVPLSGERPGPEGYVIRVLPWGEDRRAVLIGGSDDQGALYGCYSLEQLLQVREGVVFAREARVDDWPGSRWRVTGWGAETYQQPREATLEDLEHLLRLRFNLSGFTAAAPPT
jgi:hypothetical protein